ncbi:DNA cytosine methyltransferase [Streptomyces sp. NPDC004288]
MARLALAAALVALVALTTAIPLGHAAQRALIPRQRWRYWAHRAGLLRSISCSIRGVPFGTARMRRPPRPHRTTQGETVTRPRLGSWCTGYGGLDQAVQRVFGTTTAWASDIDPGAARIISHRMPGIPNLGDLTTTDWQAVLDEHGPVDIVCGGYPCQPFSAAGKRKGTSDARHIWPYIADALRVLRPRIAIFENVSGHLRLGFDTVLADLARLGFDAEWRVVSASSVGAPHQRRRLILLAWPADAQGPGLPGEGLRGRAAERGAAPADAADIGHERGGDARRGGHGPADHGHAPADTDASGRGADEPPLRPGQPDADWGRFAPAIARWEFVLGRRAPRATDDRRRLSPVFVEWLMGLDAGHVTDVPGLSRTQQLKALGNGVVPQQAEAAIRHLYTRARA